LHPTRFPILLTGVHARLPAADAEVVQIWEEVPNQAGFCLPINHGISRLLLGHRAIRPAFSTYTPR
jgi:hypothetical protein